MHFVIWENHLKLLNSCTYYIGNFPGRYLKIAIVLSIDNTTYANLIWTSPLFIYSNVFSLLYKVFWAWGLKYQFWKKSLRKNETLAGWTLSQHICLHFWAWLLNTIAITPKSEDKYVVKVFNPPEFHFSEVTSFKIGTLVRWTTA